MKIEIDPEFAAFWPLSPSEREGLEKEIVAHGGAHASLLVWKCDGRDILLDGHHRHEICTRLNLPFTVKHIKEDLPDREAALMWIARHQRARRNMTSLQGNLSIGFHYLRLLKLRHRNGRPQGHTAEHVADTFGVSVRKVKMYAADAKDIDSDLKAKIESREIQTRRDLLDELKWRRRAAGDDTKGDPGGEPPDDPTTQPGDIWMMGHHLLLCGDAANVDDVLELTQGEPVDLVHSDPPYNVDIQPRAKGAASSTRPRDRRLQNDFITKAQFEALLRDAFANAAHVLRPGGGFYLWAGYSNLDNYPQAIKAAGLHWHQLIVWDKQWPTQSRCDYMQAVEFAFYGWRPGRGVTHEFHGPRGESNLWAIKGKSNVDRDHLTEKPVALPARAIVYSSRPGDYVLDLFAGSGSTLIACEEHDRIGRMLELDQAYCDVIVKRWEKHTGRKAERISRAERHDAVRADLEADEIGEN